jgi:Flp pilus assembly protein TadG
MRVRGRLRRQDGEEGATLVIVALLLVVFMGALAISVDFGAMFLKRRQLVNAADAAALAAAQSYFLNEASCGSNDGPAQSKADQLATANVAGALPDSTAGHTPYSVNCGQFTVTVQYHAAQPHFFAQAIGMGNSTDVHSKATATWGGAGGAQKIVPLMLSLGRLTTCDIPYGVEIGDVCVWYWDNAEIGNAQWGVMDLDKWNVAPAASCGGNSDFNHIRQWIQNGYSGPLLLKQPPPTYVCIGTGNFGNALDNEINGIAGQIVPFPVNDPAKQVASNGSLCPPPGTSCTVQKYAIVGFAKLQVLQLYDNRNSRSQWNLYCSEFAQNSNARCLVTTWQGFDDTGYVPGGQNFGFGAVGLKG